MPILKILITTAWISFLAGCATGSKDTILPQDGPSMKEVYDAHFTGEELKKASDEEDEEEETGLSDMEQDEGHGFPVSNNIMLSRLRRHESDTTDWAPYTRTANTEIQNIFPRLKNKTLILYVFPHLSRGERHPIPGYATAFQLYEHTEYALPGEKMEGY